MLVKELLAKFCLLILRHFGNQFRRNGVQGVCQGVCKVGMFGDFLTFELFEIPFQTEDVFRVFAVLRFVFEIVNGVLVVVFVGKVFLCL